MKSAFMCFSSKNRDLVDLYVSKLKNSVVIKTGIDLDIRESFVTKAKKTLENVDYIIVLLTNEFLKCTWTINDLSSVFMQENRQKYVVVRYPNALIPSYLHNTNIVEYDVLVSKIDKDWDITFLLNLSNKNDKLSLFSESTKEILDKSKSKPITVVCGAGVSKQPSWNDLLNSMINDYLLNIGYSSKEIIEEINVSGLGKAQFLQKVFKNDFFQILGDKLYSGTDDTELTIKSVAEFCTRCKTIQSVITYNFDLVLEETINNINCRYTSICNKTKDTEIEGLPIYHVHGILDKNYKNSRGKRYDLVFCEKSYHTQYSEPYSWSNLLQLDKFSNSLCIFVGISLTDPNMRRLLDIAHRNHKSTYHLMIMKANQKDEFTDTIIEQNANELGVSIIWVNDHKEIPSVLENLQSQIDKMKNV